jgi:hypothetical protein
MAAVRQRRANRPASNRPAITTIDQYLDSDADEQDIVPTHENPPPTSIDLPFSSITGGDPAELFEEDEDMTGDPAQPCEQQHDREQGSDSATDPDSELDLDATADVPASRHRHVSSTIAIRTQLARREENTSLHPIQKYCSAFFKKKDIRDYIKKMDPLSRREKILKEPSYAKEFIVWLFWSEGSDPAKSDDKCAQLIRNYLECIFSGMLIQILLH